MVNKLSPSLFDRKCERQAPLDPAALDWRRIGCLLWRPSIGTHPYGVVKIGGENWTAHRAAYTVFKGPIPDGLGVLHHCDTPRCCEPAHLYAGTAKNNWQDMISRGRHPFAGRFPPGLQSKPRVYKLRPEDVRRIMQDGEAPKKLAAELGVARATISKIRSGVSKRLVSGFSDSDWAVAEHARLLRRQERAHIERRMKAAARRAAGDMRRHDLLDTVA